MSNVAANTEGESRFLLDVRTVPAPQRHPKIHEKFDALEPGQSLVIVNDHDPKPLFYELQAEKGDRFDAENYHSYRASDDVFVAVFPTKTA